MTVDSQTPSSQQHPAARQEPSWLRLGRVAFLVAGLYFVLNFSVLIGERFSLSPDDARLSYALLFVAGTLTGFHCAGMCGSLVIGYTVRAGRSGGRPKYWVHLLYGTGKTLSYTVLGGLFGFLGSIVSFTPALRGGVGLGAGVFLGLFGLSSLDLLPIRRHLQFRLPPAFLRGLGALLRRAQHPFVVGLLNGLMIICGPLQAMYIMAAGTGNPIEGAKMLFFFGLGTLPLMLGFGFLASALSGQFAPRLVRASGVIVIALGLIMAQRGYALLTRGEDIHAAMGHGSPLTHSAEPMVHSVMEGPGPLSETPVLSVGIPVTWMMMGEALDLCGPSVRWRPVGGEISMRDLVQGYRFTPERTGRLEWECETRFSSGAFEVREPPAVGPRFEVSEPIHRLIERSGAVLDSLRSRLKP